MLKDHRPALAPWSRRIRGALATALAVLVLPLAGCGFLPLPPPDAADSTPTGETVPAELGPYYSQVLHWQDCGGGAQCTTAIAPLNWDDPTDGRDISLALSRQTATGASSLGSLFVNPGGPGASGYDLVHDSIDFAVTAPLLENYDVIGWDPRGVGRSSAVTCYDDAGLDDFLYDIPAAKEGTPEWTAEVTGAAKDFAAACLQNTGPLLEFVDTQSTVRDLDMLRAVVGDEALHYLGYSYGSDIGMFYADRFPKKVGRMVLDGSTDSTVDSFDVSLTQTIGFDRALRAYLADCPNSADCPFAGDVDKNLRTIEKLIDGLDAQPIAAPDGRMLDGGVLDTAMSMALYDEGSWPYLNALFAEAQAGQTGTAFELADQYFGRESDGSYSDNSLEAFVAISCVDYPVVTDPAEIARNNAKLEAVAPEMPDGSPLGDVECANWPFSYRGGPPTAVTGTGAAPLLIVSTKGDPATPYEWGVALSTQLESAQLITYNGEGHTAYGGGVACIDSTVEDYFVRGTVPATDPQCPAG